jgi:hypothetical protein
MYYPQNIILECGLKDKIEPIFVVDDVFHYPVPMILNNSLHQLTDEDILGVFHQENELPV